MERIRRLESREILLLLTKFLDPVLATVHQKIGLLDGHYKPQYLKLITSAKATKGIV